MIRRPFTDLERDRALALGKCRFSAGGFDKRWNQMMADRIHSGAAKTITEKEAGLLERMAWKYRKQLDARLVPDVKPPETGPAPKVAPILKAVPHWNLA